MLKRGAGVLMAAVLAGCAPLGGSGAPSASTSKATSSPAVAATPAPTIKQVSGPELARGPDPSGGPRRTVAPEPEPFAMDLYTAGDFVPQHTFEWCVAASIQMTYNMARDPNRSSAEDQGEVWELARARSNDRWGGASGGGWAKLLTEWGVGEYELTSYPDFDAAVRTAARAMRSTELAVGLIMWRGRHAWVMSGFESIGDPAIHADFIVTGIRVLDPLYPYGDDRWGPSPEPNALLTPEELARQFQGRGTRESGIDSPAGWVVVLPVEPQS